MHLSTEQIQRNLENIQYVRSLLKRKSDGQSQTRAGKQTLEDSQEPGPGEG